MGSNISEIGVGVGLLLCYNKSTGRGARAPTLLEQMVCAGRKKLTTATFPAAAKIIFLGMVST